MLISCVFIYNPNIRFSKKRARRAPLKRFTLKRNFILKTHSAKHFPCACSQPAGAERNQV
ncbi:hypothetical protein [Neisseria meningitidis serogroup B]|uniref:Uncharacterized protein n=1 Tax=Neisseria meningitidis serogroup B TaxID=491 RepID=A0A0H5QEG1_NEIMI|nr:hypothetical protein [Neisseria meningitidis serogroup B]